MPVTKYASLGMLGFPVRIRFGGEPDGFREVSVKPRRNKRMTKNSEIAGREKEQERGEEM